MSICYNSLFHPTSVFCQSYIVYLQTLKTFKLLKTLKTSKNFKKNFLELFLKDCMTSFYELHTYFSNAGFKPIAC